MKVSTKLTSIRLIEEIYIDTEDSENKKTRIKETLDKIPDIKVGGLTEHVKTKFKEWKSGWREQHLKSGEEFDEENYIEGIEPFFTDIK